MVEDKRFQPIMKFGDKVVSNVLNFSFEDDAIKEPNHYKFNSTIEAQDFLSTTDKKNLTIEVSEESDYVNLFDEVIEHFRCQQDVIRNKNDELRGYINSIDRVINMNFYSEEYNEKLKDVCDEMNEAINNNSIEWNKSEAKIRELNDLMNMTNEVDKLRLDFENKISELEHEIMDRDSYIKMLESKLGDDVEDIDGGCDCEECCGECVDERATISIKLDSAINASNLAEEIQKVKQYWDIRNLR